MTQYALKRKNKYYTLAEHNTDSLVYMSRRRAECRGRRICRQREAPGGGQPDQIGSVTAAPGGLQRSANSG